MNKYFDIKDTLYKITETYEEAIDLLVGIGLEQMKDIKQRETFGKTISLEMALAMKQVNAQTFEERLVEAIEENKAVVDGSLVGKIRNTSAKVKIEGILPCPVRIPLLESFEKWVELQDNNLKDELDYELKAASMGVDWLVDAIRESESADVLSDIFISAGFDLFFDKQLIGKYKDLGVFKDFSAISHYNKDFENEEISLKDPAGQYSMLAVVPAVFLVNTEELGDRELPKSWEDILKPEFENAVSLPIGDFDLFNAILLNIYKVYGEKGITQLGKSLLRSMHPAEMVKSHRKKHVKPVVTIMPYFFTKMTKHGGPMKAIWPEDGAIISPIFLLSKADKQEKLEQIVHHFSSKGVGEILSHQGLFPSVHPEVANGISPEQKYMWLGWDYINSVDMGPLIKELENIFHNSVAK